jgi:hypothetical protein
MVLSHNMNKQRIYIVIFIMYAIVQCSFAMQQGAQDAKQEKLQEAMRRLLDDDSSWRSPRMGKTRERMQVLKDLPILINGTDDRITALQNRLKSDQRLLSDEQRDDLNNQLKGWQDSRRALYELLKNDDKYGRAIACGLAGDDTFKDERIADVWEGVQLGALMRVSRACSDALSKRIENTIDRVIGGTWDFFIGKLVRGFEILDEDLMHGGEAPFNVQTLKGWQDLIKVSFDDIEKLLKDGLKDSLRGHDMSLRDPDQEAEEENQQVPVINAWLILINGYARQFDYVVTRIDKHLTYYDEEDLVVFYGKEIKQRLLEVVQLLAQGKSLKEFDASIDSNKALMVALRKNVLNLFTRLIELVDDTKSKSPLSNGFSSSSRGSLRSGRDDARNSLGSSEDDSFPGSFRSL